MAIEVRLKDAPKAWEVDSPADMLDALEEISALGYRGELSCFLPSADAPERTWELRLNAENGVGGEVCARIGDRLLLAGGALQCLTANEWADVAR